jgi:hypothetical protein
MGGRLLLVAILLAAECHGEIIDRVVAVVGRRAITESDVVRDIRLAAFLNRAEPDLSPVSRRRSAERLVERLLIRTERIAGQYDEPRLEQVAAALGLMKKERFKDETDFAAALSQSGISEDDLRAYLLEQLAVVSFVDERFGPAVQVSNDEISDYYASQFIPAWKQDSQGPAPGLDDVRGQIEKILRARQADVFLSEWLKDARGRTRIEFKEEALQ